MSRVERKNMIEFLELMKGTDPLTFAYMTDHDIEHLYNKVYEQMVFDHHN
ncbi:MULTISPECIES: BH0509 family protein [Sutcliffiella]|uniref:Transporter n=1 Tax=Sutcliffiella cohnii TaxID=33932 RepID=A0A223KLN5_9BACI|nr:MULTISPECIES: BH0509 family protein [Sutcliffiella]AST90243.1 transporter [Sutcliffiella cohnii]MED4015712.1 BH0509 family protein [Sutcliffiella cohnii]WBL15897.1 BH0509 family protein [Sutcliffiella sp. NC1]